MKRKQQLKFTADEQDGLTGWRHYLHWKPGERRHIKQRYNRRIRRVWKDKLSNAPEVKECPCCGRLVKVDDTIQCQLCESLVCENCIVGDCRFFGWLCRDCVDEGLDD